MTKIAIDRSTVEQVLEALTSDPNAVVEVSEGRWKLKSHLAIAALRAALAEPVQEPVAWECRAGGLRRLTQRQYEAQPDNIKRHYTRIEPVQEPATLPGPGLVMCPACCSQFDPALNLVEPVQEGCYHCKHFAAVKCKVCGRTT